MRLYTRILLITILIGLFSLALFSAMNNKSISGRNFRRSSPADSLLVCPPEVVKAKKCPEYQAAEVVAHALIIRLITLNGPDLTNFTVNRKPVYTSSDDDDDSSDDDDYDRSYYGGSYSGGGSSSGK